MGCHKNNEEDQKDSIFFSGIYEYKDWDDDIGTYKHPVVPNQDVAIAVATQIFRGMVDNNLRENYVPQMVFYDKVDEIWIVSFWENNIDDKIEIIGGDCNIAIQKSDGKVLRVWFGE